MEPELLDAPVLGQRDLQVALANVADANFFFGGLRSLRRHLAIHVEAAGRLTFLDVGTGNGTVSERLAELLGNLDRGAGGARGANDRVVRWVGIDLRPATLRVARAELGARKAVRGSLVGLAAADALRLPFLDDSFDVATTTLTLHHFDDEATVAVLREMARVSKRAVVVSDLERRRLNYLGARLLGETIWRGDSLARTDAALSVRRSFTIGELRALADRVPLNQVVIRRYFPFRIVMEGRP